MTLVQLRHLLSLAQTGSFRRSAETLFITQPALSRSIQALESELGQALFDRVGRRTELTAFGQEVLARAGRLVSEAEHLKESAHRHRDGQEGRLRLGLSSGPAAVLAPALMRHLLTRHPGTRLEILQGQFEQLELALRERRLDALVADARLISPSALLSIEPAGELRGAFMCRPGHPLTKKRPLLRFPALLDYPIITSFLSDEINRLLLERYGPQAHLQDHLSVRCESLDMLASVARSTDAILLAVRASAPDLHELVLRPALNVSARFALVTLPGRSEPPLLQVLRTLLRRTLHD
ncbi:MAG: LysR family transcriptional regulator [Burkholderiaceae bacterium]